MELNEVKLPLRFVRVDLWSVNFSELLRESSVVIVIVSSISKGPSPLVLIRVDLDRVLHEEGCF